jgi:hypothetical protein
VVVNHCTHLDFLGSTVNPWKIKWQMLGMSIDINSSISVRNSRTDIKCIHSNTISSPWISFYSQTFLLCHLTLLQVQTSEWCLSKVSLVARLAIISLKLHCSHEETGWLYGSKWYISDQNSQLYSMSMHRILLLYQSSRLLSHLTWMQLNSMSHKGKEMLYFHLYYWYISVDKLQKNIRGVFISNKIISAGATCKLSTYWTHWL